MNGMCAALRIIITRFDIRAQKRQVAVVVGVHRLNEDGTKGNDSIKTIDRTRVTEVSTSRRSNCWWSAYCR
jgi:hypothetical protein